MRASVVEALMTVFLLVTAPLAADAGSVSVGVKASRPVVATDTSPPSLTALRVWPEPWVGRHGLTIAFRIADRGAGDTFRVGFTVRDLRGRWIAHVGGLKRPRGADAVRWNVRNAGGGIVPNGAYRVVVHATDRAGNSVSGRPVPFRLARPVHASVVSRVDDAGRRIALTFDDCGDRTAWVRILNALDRAHATATFFCVGDEVPRWPTLARRTVHDGIAVGNHTWSHVDLAASSLTTDRTQIQRDGAAWWAAARATPIPLLRPPGGSYDASTIDVAGSLGYRWVVLWNVDPKDWTDIPKGSIVRRVLAGAASGAIVCLHVRPATAAALPAILRGLAARHLTPVTLPALLRSGTPDAGWWPARSHVSAQGSWGRTGAFA
jgi:peptidoglycan/xylan/chitin deacetylase (PgdA/CDA1 family)